jgi:hypothetical protein
VREGCILHVSSPPEDKSKIKYIFRKKVKEREGDGA